MTELQEKDLHQIWQARLYESLFFTPHGSTPTDATIEIIDHGAYNTHGGPDFFNVKVRIGNLTLVGNGEVHLRASDWYRHQHHQDPNYNNVILHIVLDDDEPVYTANGNQPLTCLVSINQQLIEKAREMVQKSDQISCADKISQFNACQQRLWLDRLFVERMEQQQAKINEIYQQHHQDLYTTAYILLMRYLGGTVNNQAFQIIAQTTPLNIIHKHTNSQKQLEALLIGQAGLLQPDTQNEDNPYRQTLLTEYEFLKHKYSLTPLTPGTIKMFRLRPASFPQRRLALMATLLHANKNLISDLIESQHIKTLMATLRVQLPDYWQSHCHFGSPSQRLTKSVSKQTVEMIAINVITPIRFFQARLKGLELDDIKEQIECHKIPPEKNRITRIFQDAGLELRAADDTQAVLQLYHNYCLARRCFNCNIGRQVLDAYKTGSPLLPSTHEPKSSTLIQRREL